MHRHNLLLGLTVALVLAALACRGPIAEPRPTRESPGIEGLTATAGPETTRDIVNTLPASPAAFAQPLGTQEDPIIWRSVPGHIGHTHISQFTERLERQSGLHFEAAGANSYADLIEAACSVPPKAHLVSLPAFAYLLAHDRCGVQAGIVAAYYGSTTTRGQFIARAGSGIPEVTDLKGHSFCRPDPLSTSGWHYPNLTMKAAGVDPQEDLRSVTSVGSHHGVVVAVYTRGCEAGSTYVDARESVVDKYPDVLDKVAVVELTPGVPNLGIQFVPGLDVELKTRIIDAVIATASDQEPEQEVWGSGWTGFEREDDSFYDPLRELLRAADMSASEFE